MSTPTPSCSRPDALIIHPSFIRVNGPDGRPVARANLRRDGQWDVRPGPGADWFTTTEGRARRAMEAAATTHALSIL